MTWHLSSANSTARIPRCTMTCESWLVYYRIIGIPVLFYRKERRQFLPDDAEHGRAAFDRLSDEWLHLLANSTQHTAAGRSGTMERTGAGQRLAARWGRATRTPPGAVWSDAGTTGAGWAQPDAVTASRGESYLPAIRRSAHLYCASRWL